VWGFELPERSVSSLELILLSVGRTISGSLEGFTLNNASD